MEDLKKIQSEVAQLELKKQQLHDEIGQYGKDLEALHEKIVKAESAQSNIDSLKSEIASLEGIKDQLISAQNDLTTIENTRGLVQSDVDQYRRMITDFREKSDALNALSADISDIENKLAGLQDKLTQLNGTLEYTTLCIKANDKKLSDQEELFTKNTENFKTLHAEESSKFSVVLEEIKASIQQKLTEKHNIESSIESLIGIVKVAEEKVNVLTVQYSELDGLYTMKKTTKEQELQEMQVTLNEKEVALNKREGDIALKDTGLDQKRRTLEIMKMRLEKEKGSSITIEI